MSIANTELEWLEQMQPDPQSHLTESSDRPRLTNGIKDPETKAVWPIDPKVILEKIADYTNGWPVVVGGELVVRSAQNDLEIRKNEKQFFAWLHNYFEVNWLGGAAISKAEFFEFCRSNAEQYTDATSYPHFPAIENVLYNHPSPIEGTGQALEGLLDFFTPATEHDRELILAFILTLFWGGPPGSRPAFLITSDDESVNQGRGFGKTTLLELCGNLCGGLLRLSQVESVETISKRIVNQANNRPRPRIISIDNVKSRRFSWADLESMITSQEIAGHRLWSGNGPVTNFHTFAITINGPCLAKDLAQRVVVIKLGKPSFSPTWQHEVSEYISGKKWEIIGDIEAILSTTTHPLPMDGTTRFGLWEHGVLSKISDAVEVRNLIAQRQRDLDDDDANQKEFGQFLVEKLELIGPVSPSTQVAPGVRKIAHDQMHSLYQEFTGEKVGKNGFKSKVERYSLPSLRCINQPGKARSWLFRIDMQELTLEQLQQATSIPIAAMDEEEDEAQA
jgi:hypothetical protein